MQRDRFLFGILIGIGVLIVLALVLFFIRQGSITYVDDLTPEGALQNYILAVQKRDYTRAYGYLADISNKPSQVRFQQELINAMGPAGSSAAVQLGKPTIDEKTGTAFVPVTFINSGQDLFSGSYSNTQSAMLVQENGAWKVSNAPYPFWMYDWQPLENPLP